MLLLLLLLLKIKITRFVLKSSIQITNYGINQLLQLIKLNHRGEQLMVPRYKNFLIDIQIIVEVLNTCIISK